MAESVVFRIKTQADIAQAIALDSGIAAAMAKIGVKP